MQWQKVQPILACVMWNIDVCLMNSVIWLLLVAHNTMTEESDKLMNQSFCSECDSKKMQSIQSSLFRQQSILKLEKGFQDKDLRDRQDQNILHKASESSEASYNTCNTMRSQARTTWVSHPQILGPQNHGK